MENGALGLGNFVGIGLKCSSLMAFVHQQSQGAGVGSSHHPSCSWLDLSPLDHFTQPGETIQVKKKIGIWGV